MPVIDLGQEIKIARNNLQMLDPEPVPHTTWPNTFEPQPMSGCIWPSAPKTVMSYNYHWRLHLWDNQTQVNILIPSERSTVGDLLYLPPLDEIEVEVNNVYRAVSKQLLAVRRQPFIRISSDDHKGQCDLQRLFDGVEINVSIKQATA